jgi:hypothetical protein
MGPDSDERGHGSYKPLFVVDEETGNIVPVYLPADAVADQAKPGAKAGNPVLDDINEQLRQEGLAEKMKELYRKDSGES